MMTTLMLAGSLAGSGCTDDESPAGDDGTSEGSTGAASDGSDGGPASSTGAADETGEDGTSTGDAIDVDALYECEEPELVVVQPLVGPGIDPETGALLEPLQDEYVLHTTQIWVRPEEFERFLALGMAVGEQLGQTDGLVGFGLAYEPTCGFQRTMGIWRDEQSMLAFVGSGAHAEAMTMTREVSLTGRTTHWVAGADQMPLTWEMALEALADVEPSPFYD